MFDFVTFHADLGAIHGAPKMGSTDRTDLLGLMGRSAALFHEGATLTLLTNEKSEIRNPLFQRIECPVRAESLMLDRTLAQAEYLARCDFKRPVVFLDTDMLFNDSLCAVLEEDFDVAVTWRDKDETPINGGLIILNNRRPERSLQFFNRLTAIYRKAHGDNASWDGDQFALQDFFDIGVEEIARSARRDYAGIKVLFLPCEEYNFSPTNKRRAIKHRLSGKVLIHFKGPRKWLMPRYWDAHLAPLDHSKQRNAGMFFNLDNQAKPAWVDRAEKCADLLAQVSDGQGAVLRVCDLGCGDQKLKRILAQRGLTFEYQGYDLKPQSAAVEALDIERDVPSVPADVAVVLGVIEYLSDLDALFRRLAAYAPAMVVSHVTRDRSEYSDRQLSELGWKNHLPSSGLEDLLTRAGWDVQSKCQTDDRRTGLWLAKSRTLAR